MKKIHVLRMAIAAVALFLLVFAGCKKNQDVPAVPGETAQKVNPGGPPVVDENPLARTATCSSPFLNGSYSGTGYYTYPADYLDVTCVANGATITLSCNSIEVPNRFNVYNSSGTLIATTGWIGYANYPGPWGSSLNGPQSRTLSFTKSGNSYRVTVETVGGSISDAWEATLGCTCAPTGGCTSCPTCNCGYFYNGSYGGTGYYTYPARNLTFDCNVNTITLNCNSIEVPNRFNVYNANGTLVATTGWIGYASYPGPWGSSLNGPQSRTISFSRSTTTFRLVVETVGGPITDAWEASTSCTFGGG